MTFLQRYRGHLFYKYGVIFVTLVSGTLLTSGLIEIYFSYQETRTALTRLQWEEAENAALKIRQFLKDLERQMAWTLQPLGAQVVPLEQRHDDYYRLLHQVSAITELSYLDASGREQLCCSRLSRNVVRSGADASREAKFLEAKSRKTYFSAVYFRNEYEPYMTIAVAERGPDGGVTVAEVDLRLILDVVSRIRVGEAGYAYAVDAHGRLIVHPDISLVLQKTDLSSLYYIQAALAGLAASGEERQETTIARDLRGRQVLTTYEVIDPPGWHVLVEQPLEQAFAPLYASMWRTALLLLVSLGIAVLVSLVLARKMVIPIQALQAGVARVASGHLDIVIPPRAARHPPRCVWVDAWCCARLVALPNWQGQLRRSLPAPSTPGARGGHSPSWWSTAPPCRTSSSPATSLVMKKGPSLERTNGSRGSWSWRLGARCSSMQSVSCHPRFRASCCESSRNTLLSG